MVTTVKKIVEIAKEYQNSQYDFIVAISGFTGRGKSVLANHIVKEGNRNKYDMETQNIYTRKELKKAMDTFPPKTFFNIDEAINVLFRREFYKGDQIAIVKTFDRVRFKKYCIVLSLPVFWDLDKKVLPRINIWIYVDRRGIGYVFKRDENPMSFDCWHRRENEKALRNWSRGAKPTRCINFVDTILFDDLNITDKKQYDKMQKVKKMLQEKEDKEKDKWLYEQALRIARNYTCGIVEDLNKKQLLNNGWVKIVADRLEMTPGAFKMKMSDLRKKEIEMKKGKG